MSRELNIAYDLSAIGLNAAFQTVYVVLILELRKFMSNKYY